MICIGYSEKEKIDTIENYLSSHTIKKVFILYHQLFPLLINEGNVEHIEYADIIRYKFFYRLLEEIDRDTLVVINECLRTQNRNDLTYNCIRHYLNQAGHQIIFQYLPMIDNVQDFMTLFDFDTKSRWKRESFRQEMLSECTLHVNPVPVALDRIDVKTSDTLKAMYEKEKKKLFDNLGQKDPHTIPRNLYLVSGKEKLKAVDPFKQYVGRNNRFKMVNMVTYDADHFCGDYVVFELPHNFGTFCDFLALSGQTRVPVLVADTKTENWYWERYQDWLTRLYESYSSLQ